MSALSAATASALIVEDDPVQSAIYMNVLKSLGVALVSTPTIAAARAALMHTRYSVALVDVHLPDGSGIDLIAEIHASNPNCVVVMATGVDSVESALAATRAGAADYLVKPISITRLGLTMRNVIETSRLRAVVRTMEGATRSRFHNFVGASPVMQALYRMIETISQSRAPVFILGESGTGKELCADSIHRLSPRHGKPFIAINCAAIPAGLIESELFGHVKGAFSGATSDRMGAVVAADGGTLMLDEICEMDINVQAKLLRLLQTGEIKRVGENRTQRVDVRVVCATNRDPWLEMKAGRFREDLFYRLFVLPIELPPLRDRGADVVLIAKMLLPRFAAEEAKPIREFAPAALELLLRHSWPGNVRELLNALRAAVIFTQGTTVDADTVRDILERGQKATSERATTLPEDDAAAPSLRRIPVTDMQTGETSATVRPLAELERVAIEHALSVFNGNVGRAADALGVNMSTLYRKIKTWRLPSPA